MLDRDLRPTLDVWTREDPTLLRGTQPKSKAPCPPNVEQAAKQLKLTDREFYLMTYWCLRVPRRYTGAYYHVYL